MLPPHPPTHFLLSKYKVYTYIHTNIFTFSFRQKQRATSSPKFCLACFFSLIFSLLTVMYRTIHIFIYSQFYLSRFIFVHFHFNFFFSLVSRAFSEHSILDVHIVFDLFFFSSQAKQSKASSILISRALAYLSLSHYIFIIFFSFIYCKLSSLGATYQFIMRIKYDCICRQYI